MVVDWCVRTLGGRWGVHLFNVLEVTTVKAPHRSALVIAGFAAVLAASVAPASARAQRNQGPGPDTKKALVTAFRGDVEGGVKAADEIRNRIQGEYSIKVLMPISKKNIDATLLQSGYKPDSALSPNDIKELAKLLSADEVIDGVVTKTASGYRVATRMFLPRDPNLSQPLVTVESNNFGDIARQVVDEYDRARKQIPDNQACENAIRANAPSAAILAARKGLVSYPRSTLLRLCMASAYAAAKTTADSTGPWKDSVIALTKSTLDLDKTNKIALTLQYDAYTARHDTANALDALIGLMNADPTNSTTREQVIATLVNMGKADAAIPTAKQLVTDNPGDPAYARTYWLVLRAAKRYKDAVAAGMAYVAADSAAADSGYFQRQIADLASDSSYAKAAELAAVAAAKYPKSSTFYLLKGQNERKAGQLPAAKASLERALAIDPKLPGVSALVAQLSFDQGAPDVAVKLLKADVASDPSNKERDAQLIVSFAQKMYQAAAASKSVEDYRKTIPIAQASEEMNPSAAAKFFLAISAFQVLATTSTELQKSKNCEEYKAANEMLTLVSTNMPGGGSISPETAKQVLGAVPQFQAFIEQSIKKYCK